ncbi:unnamed protein product [Fraxinus pennsylvanica]|uniref:NB-ARC domain-containing protein n=1 Tax=Fraxinus pennsylvanica TaxID=56036 RepID=A0AAD1ZPV8_9LAMI|nr:unnamed protein product [Fraxinus pennsylvanica]
MDKWFEFSVQLPNVVAQILPNLEEKTETLQRKIRLLETRKDDVKDATCRSGKKRKTEVEDWMDKVEDIMNDFGTLEQRVAQNSRFYHVFKRQKLAEQLKRMIDEVTELDAQSEFPSGLFLEVDESIDRLLLIPEPNGRAFRQNSEDIWPSLTDVNAVSIGIYGMKGVGKTTLAQHVHDRLLRESIFSGHVYWVTVSQEFNIYKLQSDIAQVLKLNIEDDKDEGKRAAKLFQKFQKMERFVLILDDVWKQINAEKIGIPSKRDGCKLVVTSRSEEVCRRMNCKKIIKVNTLSEQEALDLFWKTLDRDELSVEAEEICEEMKPFWQNDILFTGGEDRNVTAWDAASGKVAYRIEDAHAARVKGIVVLSKISDSGEEDPYIVASASPDGVIHIWDVRVVNKEKTNPLAEANTRSKLTCLA